MEEAVIDWSYSNLREPRLEQFATRTFGDLSSLQNAYMLARHAIDEKIPGCFVECGVANGGCAAAMIKAGAGRRVHLFDSFEGIPLAGPRDRSQPGKVRIEHDQTLPIEKRLVSSGVAVCTLDHLREHFNEWGLDQQNVVCHPGWFQKTLAGLAQFEPIALLRLDVDLVESYEICLRALYPFVADRGWVIIDDWTLSPVDQVVKDFLASIGETPEIRQPCTSYGSACWEVRR